MEQTLEEKLYDLQCFKAKSLVFCELSGNDLGWPYFQIDWIRTAGGEQFVFRQVLGVQLGSGVYYPTRKEMCTYAESIVGAFLTKFRLHKPSIMDADWHKKGLLADCEG